MRVSGILLGLAALGAVAYPAIAQDVPGEAPPTAPPVAATVPAPQPAAPAAATDNPDSAYVLGPGDVIEVSVLGQNDFNTRARVRTDGTIALPYLGSTAVAGETPISLSAQLADRLRAGGYYIKPVVNVEVAGFASRYVIVLGAVASPGLQSVDRAYRVSEIIARSGGMRDSAADHVVLRREGGEEMKLPFEKLATGGDADDPYVRPGDKLFVPTVQTFYIYGQIAAPGVYGVMPEMTLRKAIARGGGLGPSGSDKRVKVFRKGQEIKADLDTLIMPDDVVVVGERLF